MMVGANSDDGANVVLLPPSFSMAPFSKIHWPRENQET